MIAWIYLATNSIGPIGLISPIFRPLIARRVHNAIALLRTFSDHSAIPIDGLLHG